MHAVVVGFGLVADASQQLALVGGVDEQHVGHGRVAAVPEGGGPFETKVAPFLLDDAFHVRQHDLLAETEDLRGHGQRDDFLHEPRGVDLDLRHADVHLETRPADDIQVGDNLRPEGDVDERRQDGGQERGDEVHDKGLLRLGEFVLVLRAVVFVLRQAGGNVREKVRDGRQGHGEQDRGHELQVRLQGAVVHFRDEHLGGKTHDDHAAQGQGRSHSKGNEQQLACELLAGRERLGHFAGDRVDGLMVTDILHPGDLERAHVLDIPTITQVHLPDLPVLDKHHAPDTVDQPEREGVGTKVEPADDAPDSGEDEKGRVAVDKGIVKGHLLSKEVPNGVQVVVRQRDGVTPFGQQSRIGSHIMQRERGRDILPFPEFGSDARTTQASLPADGMIDRPELFVGAFGFGDGVFVSRGDFVQHAVQKVFYPINPYQLPPPDILTHSPPYTQ